MLTVNAAITRHLPSFLPSCWWRNIQARMISILLQETRTVKRTKVIRIETITATKQKKPSFRVLPRNTQSYYYYRVVAMKKTKFKRTSVGDKQLSRHSCLLVRISRIFNLVTRTKNHSSLSIKVKNRLPIVLP